MHHMLPRAAYIDHHVGGRGGASMLRLICDSIDIRLLSMVTGSKG